MTVFYIERNTINAHDFGDLQIKDWEDFNDDLNLQFGLNLWDYDEEKLKLTLAKMLDDSNASK